ncbi:hypothetical protein KIPB_016610, partial [Kipferlia bialata]
VDTPSRTLSVLDTGTTTPSDTPSASASASAGGTRTPYEGGTIVRTGNSLHVSVLNGTCVHICGTVLDYALHGHYLVYSSRGPRGVYMHRVHLGQFRGTPQLPLAAEAVPAVQAAVPAVDATRCG